MGRKRHSLRRMDVTKYKSRVYTNTEIKRRQNNKDLCEPSILYHLLCKQLSNSHLEVIIKMSQKTVFGQK